MKSTDGERWKNRLENGVILSNSHAYLQNYGLENVRSVLILIKTTKNQLPFGQIDGGIIISKNLEESAY